MRIGHSVVCVNGREARERRRGRHPHEKGLPISDREPSKLVAPQGFEPRYHDPESCVLPLDEGAAI